MNPHNHGRRDERDALRPFPVTESATAGDIVERMADTAFQARNLGQAARIWEAALRDEATIFFGFADVMVSTGANLYHDVYETLGFEHAQGDPNGDDMRLAHLRVVRFYDVLAPEHEFSIGERFCT